MFATYGQRAKRNTFVRHIKTKKKKITIIKD